MKYMIVIDSSTLILLAKADLLDKIINSLKQKLTIPSRVYAETTIKKELFDAQLINERVQHKKIRQMKISDVQLYVKLINDFNIGKGEAEAITLCLEHRGTLVCDDKKAINVCRIFNIKFTTAPNLLIALRKKDMLSKEEALAVVKKLTAYGRYSKEIINKLEDELT